MWLVLAVVALAAFVLWLVLRQNGMPSETPPSGTSPSPSRTSSVRVSPPVLSASPTPDATQPTVGPLSGHDETPRTGLPTVPLSELPREAVAVVAAIRSGGPFEHAKDGSVFLNREGLLPSRPKGYYREFTVRTPGEDDRGARRIVSGQAGELFWTADHYDSFEQILEGQ